MEMFPEKIEEQVRNFYFYRAMEFEDNHRRRKNEEKRKVNFVINSLIFISLAGYLINTFDIRTLLKPSTLH